MPRSKNATKVQDLGEEQEEIAVQPKRSMRKRKAISYAEPEAEDSDWMEKTPEKRTVNRPVYLETETESELEPVGGTTRMNVPVRLDDDSEEEENPRPKRKPAPKKRTRRARDNEIEYDEDGDEIRKREYVNPYLTCLCGLQNTAHVFCEMNLIPLNVRSLSCSSFQEYPPEKFEAKLARALSQPIAVTSRLRVDNDDYPSETFDMTGSDEVKRYTVEIKLVPKCTCGDFVFRYL
jgi:hypothetical protein